MTPYYPDKLYYDRLCGLCIKCCNRDASKPDGIVAMELQSTNSSSGDIDKTTTPTDI